MNKIYGIKSAAKYLNRPLATLKLHLKKGYFKGKKVNPQLWSFNSIDLDNYNRDYPRPKTKQK